MLADGKPGRVVRGQGEALWKTQRGPKNASLEQCDLGKGPGVVKGAFVELPRWFADTGKVQDLESRLLTAWSVCRLRCGGDREDAFRQGEQVAMEGLVAWIAAAARGLRFNLPQANAEERKTYELASGRSSIEPARMTCLRVLPRAARQAHPPARPARSDREPRQRHRLCAWPAYRVSNGELWSMQRRLNDCYRRSAFRIQAMRRR